LALNGYLVEEISHDFADGLLSRREALRRLGMLGLSVTGAGAVLAACGDDDDGDDGTAADDTTSTVTTPNDNEPPGAATAVEAQAITFTGPSGQLRGAYAAAKSPKGAVLVIHENRGLTPHFLDVPGRLAGVGYSALALDLLSRRGGTAAVGDEAAAQAALGQAALPDLIADMRAAIDELEKRAEDQKIGAVGFCFGGGMVWNLLNNGESRLAAAAPFYGPCPENPDFSKAKAAVLAVYGETDSFVNPTRERAEAALKAANLKHEIKVYSGAGHAFFNNTGQRYNATAAKQAWADLTRWFDEYL
jgi:carboxymethylenebutenolidase